MYISFITISSKRQIVLPKKIRDTSKTNTISVEVTDNNQILFSPIRDSSDVLSDYQQTTEHSFEQVREQAWNDNTFYT